MNLFDYSGKLRSGLQEAQVWPFFVINSLATGMDSYTGMVNSVPREHNCRILLQFDSFSGDVYYSLRDRNLLKELQYPRAEDSSDSTDPLYVIPTNDELVRVDSILTRDFLTLVLSSEEKKLVFRSRSYLKDIDNTLPYFMTAVDW